MKELISNLENKEVEIARTIQEDEWTVVHYKVENEVVISVFKNNNIVTSIRGEYKGVNELNGRTQIDGPATPVDLDKTNQNKELIKGFFENILFKGASNTIDEISKYISSTKYHQHNVDNGIGDGLDQLLISVERMKEYGSDLQYDENELMIAQGDFVFTKSIQHWFNPETKETEDWVYFDIFRVEDDLIVEHWDILGRQK